LIAPTAPTVGIRLTPLSDNFQYYIDHTFGPPAYLHAAISSGWTQWRNSPHEWGQGADGYGRRYASALGRHLIKNTADFGVASLRGEVLGYSPCQCDGFWGRTKHAMKQTFVRPSANGGSTFAAGRLAGAYAGGFAPMLWYPDSRNGVGDALVRGSVCLGFDTGKNVFKEFWPDIKRKLFRR
jgi:hypothetical protein